MRWQWLHSELPSVQACRRSTHAHGGAAVELDLSGQARVQGVRTCGSVWACPLCSAAVWAKRGAELAHLLRAAEAEGLVVGFLTVTMRHAAGDRLADLWEAMAPALKGALGAASRDVRARRKALDVHGVVRRTEATYGANGWHLHPHLLIFAQKGTTEDEFTELAAAMFAAWRDELAKADAGVAPDPEHGWHFKLMDLSRAQEEAAGYITTAGSFHASAELTDRAGKSARLGNRTTWELLEAARSGDPRARRRWAEWEKASKGRQAWDCRSRRLRELLREHPECAERSAEPRGPETALVLREAEWKAVCAHYDVSELLDVVEREYRDALSDHEGDRMLAVADAAHAGALLLLRWGVWTTGPRGAP